MSKPVALVYFSGTGGVAMIARQFAQDLAAGSVPGKLLSLEKKQRRQNESVLASLPDDAGVMVLLYPVYALDAASPVYDWLAAAPQGKNLKTAVISVSGGGEMWPNTACRHRVIGQLEKKGYDVFYENMMVMPSNCLYRFPDHLMMHVLNAVPGKTARMAGEILSGKRRRMRFPWASWPFLWMGSWERRGARRFGDYVDIRDTCTSCGWCSRNCPQENIVMKDGRPGFGAECVMCLRCYYGCPAHAINLKKMRMLLWDEFDLEKMRERMKDVRLAPVEECAKGWMASGIRKYLEQA